MEQNTNKSKTVKRLCPICKEPPGFISECLNHKTGRMMIFNYLCINRHRYIPQDALSDVSEWVPLTEQEKKDILHRGLIGPRLSKKYPRPDVNIVNVASRKPPSLSSRVNNNVEQYENIFVKFWNWIKNIFAQVFSQ